MIAHVQYNVRHLLLYSIFSSSKSYRNLDICHFILYFLTRNHIEIEMARKYTDLAHTENSTFVAKDDLYMHSHIFAQTFAAFVISDKCTIKINNDFQAAYANILDFDLRLVAPPLYATFVV